jgi:hypothetical protein
MRHGPSPSGECGGIWWDAGFQEPPHHKGALLGEKVIPVLVGIVVYIFHVKLAIDVLGVVL